MTDAEFMLAMLQQRPGEWVAQADILERSRLERGCGLTVHSRAATLRKQGYDVECKVEAADWAGLGRRRVSFYRLALDPGAADSGEARSDLGLQTSLDSFLDASAERKAPAWA